MEIMGIGIIVLIMLTLFFLYRLIVGLSDRNVIYMVIGFAGLAIIVYALILLAFQILSYV